MTGLMLSDIPTLVPDSIYYRMMVFDPAKYRLGDVVEVQLSVVAIQYQDKYRLKTILRSLALLDSSCSEVKYLSNAVQTILLPMSYSSQNARMSAVLHPTPSLDPLPNLKRRVGYTVKPMTKKKRSNDIDTMMT